MAEKLSRIQRIDNRATRYFRKLAGIYGIENRRFGSDEVPLRRRDERGAKPEEFTGGLPFWTGYIPGVSYAVDIARIGEVGYHVYEGFKNGDKLRMPEGAREATVPEKISYLEDYLLDRFDRTNRIAKIAYHEKKLKRHMRRGAIGLGFFGGMLAIAKYVPDIHDFAQAKLGSTGGRIVEGTLGVLAGSAGIEAMLAVREYSEIKNIKSRAGKVEKRKVKRGATEVTEEQYTDEVFREQVTKAVDFIQLFADPQQRADYADGLYRKLRDIRDGKRAAYHKLTDAQQKDIVKVARKLERLDYLIDHPTRILARISRRVIDRTDTAGLVEKRRRIRDNYTFHYKEGQGYEQNVYVRNQTPPKSYRNW